jgi:hypothetical protein
MLRSIINVKVSGEYYHGSTSHVRTHVHCGIDASQIDNTYVLGGPAVKTERNFWHVRRRGSRILPPTLSAFACTLNHCTPISPVFAYVRAVAYRAFDQTTRAVGGRLLEMEHGCERGRSRRQSASERAGRENRLRRGIILLSRPCLFVPSLAALTSWHFHEFYVFLLAGCKAVQNLQRFNQVGRHKE